MGIFFNENMFIMYILSFHFMHYKIILKYHNQQVVVLTH